MVSELDEYYVLEALGESPKGIDRKCMESDRGFLNEPAGKRHICFENDSK
jgi:hypothetical protein